MMCVNIFLGKMIWQLAGTFCCLVRCSSTVTCTFLEAGNKLVLLFTVENVQVATSLLTSCDRLVIDKLILECVCMASNSWLMTSVLM